MFSFHFKKVYTCYTCLLYIVYNNSNWTLKPLPQEFVCINNDAFLCFSQEAV